MDTPLLRAVTADDAQIHIYKYSVILNEKACRLLCVLPGDRLFFFVRAECAGVPVIFVRRTSESTGFTVKKRKNRKAGFINSAPLCATLASALQGFGTYRICPESSVVTEDGRAYEIFFRKYDMGKDSLV